MLVSSGCCVSAHRETAGARTPRATFGYEIGSEPGQSLARLSSRATPARPSHSHVAIRRGQLTAHRGRLLSTIAVVPPRTRLGRTQAPMGEGGSASDSGLVVAARPAVQAPACSAQSGCAADHETRFAFTGASAAHVICSINPRSYVRSSLVWRHASVKLVQCSSK
jgi:hypothetical protein